MQTFAQQKEQIVDMLMLNVLQIFVILPKITKP